MAKQLLSSFGKKGDTSFTTTGVSQGLDQIKVDIEDTAHLSKYFQVIEFDPVFTAGKNSISFNGSDLLQDGSEIKVEILDTDGNSLYLTSVPKNSNFVDIANFTVAIYVYQETVSGAGKIYLVGTTKKGEVVRWSANININTTYQNTSRVRFYNAPFMEVRPLLYPVIQNLTGSTITTQKTITGSFWLEVQNDNGFYSPGNPNFGKTLPANTQILIWAYDGHSPNNRVDAFNSQMNGATIHLTYKVAWTPTSNSPPIYSYQTVNASTTILNVLSTNTLQIDTVPLGPIAQLSQSSTPHFTCSFTSVEYIQQSTTVPCTAPLLNRSLPSNRGFMEVKVNSDTFSSSVVGETVTLKFTKLSLLGNPIPPFNPAVPSFSNYFPITASHFTVLDVTGSRTIHTAPFTYWIRTGQNSYAPFTCSAFTGSVTVLSASNPYQGYINSAGSASLLKKSYVDIVYRNLDTFTGFVSRHKLYAQSNIYPGKFNLIDDTVLGPSELLVDPLTVNKNFSTIGNFENQDFVNQYYFPSSASLVLFYQDKPVLNSMKITPTPNNSAADGNSFVILKAGAIGVTNDEHYYPYDSASFSQFSGTGYTSNFIFLEQGTLFVLQSNLIVNKNKADTAKVMFFFTSSISSIQSEPNYQPPLGLKLGEIVVDDPVTSRVFGTPQQIFFTPLNDYYGTLLIVPVNCEVIMSNFSLKNYGDYGYSPQTCVVQIPFPINIANEKWTLKAELFDANYNLIYTMAPVIQSFDPTGASLFGSSILGTTTTGGTSNVATLTVNNNLFLPGIGEVPEPKRFLGFHPPIHNPPLAGEGIVGYTEVSDVSLIPTNTSSSTKDYINVNTVEGNIAFGGRAIAVRYSGSAPNIYGRRVYVDSTGSKHTFS